MKNKNRVIFALFFCIVFLNTVYSLDEDNLDFSDYTQDIIWDDQKTEDQEDDPIGFSERGKEDYVPSHTYAQKILDKDLYNNKYVSPMDVSPVAEVTSGNTTATLSYSKPLMPSGYPATDNPIVYTYQNITISGVLRNLGVNETTYDLTIAIKYAANDTILATALSGSTTLSAAGGVTESKNIGNISGELGSGNPLIWNTGTNYGEFYVWMQVTPSGGSSFTVDTKNDRFVIGYAQTANFSGCQTDKLEYSQEETVSLSENCTISNKGNKVIEGYIAIQIHKYDEDASEWNSGIGWPIDIITPVQITVGLGENYSVVGNLGAVTWNISNDTEAGTYRMMVAITDAFGYILNQYLGSSIVDTLENSLPGVTVDKFIDPTQFTSAGDNTTTVTLRVRHSGHSLRDAGVFATGSEAGEELQTPLDITFVVDTSGSMGYDWEGLVSVMENIINALSGDADIKHDIFGLSGTYGSYTTYTINDVVYPIKTLSSGYMGGTPVFEDDFEGSLNWEFYKNFSLTEDQSFSETHGACSIYSPEGERIFEDDAESGSGNWELVRWNYTTQDYNSSSHSFYSTLMNPLIHLEDNAEGGSGEWTLEGFTLVTDDSYSPSNSYYCGYGSGVATYFEDDVEAGNVRWDLQSFEITDVDSNSASNSFFCNYTPDQNIFHDDAEGALKWNLSSFHLNTTVFNSSTTSFHSNYVEPVVLFFDDFENGTDNWDITNWTLVNTTYYSANHSMKADNVTNTTAIMITSNSIDLTGVESVRLSFYVNTTQLYNGYVYVSTNGVNWTKLTSTSLYSSISGNSYGWDQWIYDLTSYVGNQIYLKFEFNNTYPSYGYENAFYIDDVQVDTFKFYNYMTILEPLNYTNGTYPTLYFHLYTNGTYVYLEKSQDGVTWSSLTSYSSSSGWTQKSRSLTSYMDYPYLRFKASFDTLGQFVFIDDIWVNYSTPCIMTLTNPSPLNHTGKSNMKLNLSLKENGSSYLYAERSTDGVSWSTLSSLSSSGYSWTDKQTGTLSSSYQYLRLRYLPGNPSDHAFVDDIVLTYLPECTMTSVNSVDLSDTTGRVLEYYTRYNNTASNDLYVEYSSDGSSWNTLAYNYGTQTNWTNKSHSPYTSTQYIRFRFTPMYDGQFVYIDDINLTSKRTNNMTLVNHIDTTNITKLRLVFSARYDTTATGYIQYRYADDSSTWNTVGSFSGTTSGWSGRGYDLTQYLSDYYNQLLLRFVYTPNSIGDYIYIDDIFLEATAINNMTLIVPIDLTSADSYTRLNFETLYNSQGDVDVYVSTNSGSSWTNIYTYSGTSNLQWEKITDSLDSYIGESILLRFTHKPLWTADYVCIDDVEMEEGAISKSFHSEDWAPGTEYLSEEYGWREDAVKVIFPISDECAYQGNPCNTDDTQAILDAIDACQNRSVAVYPIHGTWWETDEAANILALMNQLASACGGTTSSAENTTTLQEAIIASLSSEIKIAGKNIAVYDALVNDSEVQPDWSSFQADGSSITVPAAKKIAVGNDTVNVTFDKSYMGALASLTADPPEEVIITFTVNLSNLQPGDKRIINRGGSFIYQEPLKSQYMYGTFSGGSIEVNSGANLILFFDRGRLEDLGYSATDIQRLEDNITAYVAANNGFIYNLTKFRKEWESNKGRSAYQSYYNPVNSASITELGKWHWSGYPQDIRKLIHSQVIENNARHVLLVGSDNVIPFMRIRDPKDWEKPDYTYVTLGTHRVLWSDFPYADINGDDLQDFVLARLIGSPGVMATTVQSASTQYVSSQNTSLIAYKWGKTASSTTQPAHRDLVNTFENTFGFNNLYVYNESCQWRLWNGGHTSYTCANDTSEGRPANTSIGIYYMRQNGQSYVDRLDDGNAFIYSGSHGNDYRNPGNDMQAFSDDHKEKIGGSWHYEPDFLKASDVAGKNIGHPLFVTKSCHGGSTYADDTPNTNLPLAFLSRGAVGYIGATGYSPTVAGAIFYSRQFAPLLSQYNIGEAYMRAKRAMVFANPGGTREQLAKISHLYGIPTYMLYVPASGGSPVSIASSGLAADYNVTTNISGNDTTISVRVDTLTQENVTTPENVTATLFSISGAQDYVQPGMPIVPVIVETIELPSDADLDSILSTVSSQRQTFSNVIVPSVTDISETQANESQIYSGATIGLNETYPGNLTQYEVINESSGNKTVVFRVFAVQYNESANEVYFYQNISFGFNQTEVLVPLASLDVNTELTSTQFNANLRNTGSVDIQHALVTVQLPENLSASSVSGSGSYYSSNNSVFWNISTIETSGLSSIESIYFDLGVSSDGNYTVNTTVSYFGQGNANSSTVQISDSGAFTEVAFSDVVSISLASGWNLISIPLVV